MLFYKLETSIMIKNFLFILFLFVINTQVFAQTEDTLQTVMATDTIFSENDATNDSIKLLPSNYLITQRLLWSEKGLMRNFDYFKLSEASRDRELEIRNTMFTAHQYVGYATLAGMIAQGFVGQKLANGDKSMRGLHEGLAGAVNFGYFTTAGLALFAPPRMYNSPKGFNTLNVHKCLAIIHLSSMIATNILSGMTENNKSLVPYHKAAAFTAFGSFFASMIVIKF